MAFGHATKTRAALIASLVACGLNPSADRVWFAATMGTGGGPPGGMDSSTAVAVGLQHCLYRRLDETTRTMLIELCQRPPSLETQCCRALRRHLATRNPGHVEHDIDRLGLPPVIKNKITLRDIDDVRPTDPF